MVTGISFLGSGVIFREGVSVQGLTTAGSIGATLVVGRLFGLGVPGLASLCLLAVLTTLILTRWIERLIPWRIYAFTGFVSAERRRKRERT